MTSRGASDTGNRLADLKDLLQSHGAKLGAAQLKRIDWLVRTYGSPVLWEAGGRSRDASVQDGRVVVVIDPPSGAGAELLYGSLDANAAVVIPFGEDPTFDFLKSKLTEFGVVGTCGVDGPHELWWGGRAWHTPAEPAGNELPHVVSCYPQAYGDMHAYHLKRSLERLGLSFEVVALDTIHSDRMLAYEKADFVARMWDRHQAPLLFVDADVMLQAQPILPLQAACDFAVHKWNGWEMSTRTLYFARSKAAEALLRTWQQLASSYTAIWDAYLLDQAWSLTASQMPLDTVWLPRSYHAVAGESGAKHATIVHNLKATTADLGPDPDFADTVRPARRAGRTGARDALIVLSSKATSNKAVTVILRDFEGSGARVTAASIEAVTRAFEADCGGFARLELSLCPWQDDVRAAKEAAFLADNRVIEIAPSQELPSDLFRSLAGSDTVVKQGTVTSYRR
jgi:hypothetical protein